MSEVAPRCPFCANVVKIEANFWSRIGLKTARVFCITCQRPSDARDAHTMGASFYHWAELFRGKLTSALQSVPILSDPAMMRALGDPHKDDTRLIASLEELVRSCLRHHRLPLTEMARGREATLEVVHLHNDVSGAVEVVAILGTSSSESGHKEWEQVVARNGPNSFVLYTYPGKDGAETRVKRAAHAKDQPAVVGTNAQIVAALQASHHPKTAANQKSMAGAKAAGPRANGN